MSTVFTYPLLEQAHETFAATAGGPPHHVLLKSKYLLQNGWITVDDPEEADIRHVHGVESMPTDVLTIQAIWPVQLFPDHPEFWDVHNGIMAEAMQRAKAVVTQSSYTAKLCEKLAGVKPYIVRQAIDPDEWDGFGESSPLYDWSAEIPALGEMPIALFAKTHVDFFRDPRPTVALARARPDVAFVITAERDAVVALAGALPENVFCVGQLPFKAYRDLLLQTDVYISTTPESSGQGHIEAMYLGIPVLGYSWGALQEYVPTGRYGAGERVAPGDDVALEEALDVVLRRRKSYGKKGMKTARDSYLWPNVIHDLITLYNKVLS